MMHRYVALAAIIVGVVATMEMRPATAAAAAGCVPITPGMRTFGDARKGMSVTSSETLLYNRTGAGVVSLMWFTGELVWPTFGNTRVRVYVDGEAEPSISFEILMAVGQSQPTLSPWGETMLGNVALSGGAYFTYRIPFSTSLRVTAQLPPKMVIPGPKSFYFIIRGMTNLPVTIGALQLPATARLKLRTLEHYEAQPYELVQLYNATGPGALLQTTLSGISSNLHYLEGEINCVIDDEFVRLSSGTEDYFLSGQYFDLGTFHTPLSGCTLIDRFVNHSFAAWKLFEQDPVVWSKDFELTWEIGKDHGSLSPKQTNITTYVWAYEW